MMGEGSGLTKETGTNTFTKRRRLIVQSRCLYEYVPEMSRPQPGLYTQR